MESRTKLLLGVLGFLLLVTGWYYLTPDSGSDVAGGADGAPPAVGALPGAGHRAAGGAVAPVEYVEPLRIADLKAQPHNYTPGRDPWRFYEPPPPPSPKPRQPSAAELEAMRLAQEKAERERAAALAAQQAEAAKPKPAPFTMSYLGSFGQPGKRIAVFTDGKSIFNTLEGEVIEGKFVVAHIGYESVDIQFVGFPDWPAQRLAVGRPSR